MKKIFSEIGKVAKGVAGVYRGATDWVKPSIDKIIDPVAVFVSGNIGLSMGLYYAGEQVSENFPQITEIANNCEGLEAIAKLGIYGASYGIANAKIILPAMKKLSQRKTSPSWINHAKTWAILGSLGAMISCGDVNKDIERISHKFSEAGEMSDYVDLITTEARVLDGYFSGQKAKKLADNIPEKFNLENLLIFDVGKKDSEKILRTQKEISQRRKDFEYSGELSKDAKEFISKGYFRTPEELAYVSRVVYFEGAFDREAGNEKELREGMESIAQVILNRYEHDTTKRRKFSRKGDNLKDLVFTSHKNKKGGRTYQFTCIRDNPEYFYENGLSVYGKDGKIKVGVGGMNLKKSQLAYESVLKVLKEENENKGGDSLFYKNPVASDKYNQNWEKRYGVKRVAGVNSHDFYK